MTWIVVDSRTGQRCGASNYNTRGQVEAQIAEWVGRDARGKRQDIHDLIPHLAPAEVDHLSGVSLDALRQLAQDEGRHERVRYAAARLYRMLSDYPYRT